jgi:hypothetical protein
MHVALAQGPDVILRRPTNAAYYQPWKRTPWPGRICNIEARDVVLGCLKLVYKSRQGTDCTLGHASVKTSCSQRTSSPTSGIYDVALPSCAAPAELIMARPFISMAERQPEWKCGEWCPLIEGLNVDAFDPLQFSVTVSVFTTQMS